MENTVHLDGLFYCALKYRNYTLGAPFSFVSDPDLLNSELSGPIQIGRHPYIFSAGLPEAAERKGRDRGMEAHESQQDDPALQWGSQRVLL
jgi:hypothetical protein